MEARRARVVWDPRQFPMLLRMLAVPAGNIEGSRPIDLGEIAEDRLVVDSRGMRVWLVRDGDLSLQLNVLGSRIGKACLFAEAVSREATEERLTTLRSLSDLQRFGRLRPQSFSVYARGERLHFVLQALDRSLAGASHRSIAAALFGDSRVSAEWRDPHGHLRDVVRRAIGRGRRLMAGGYRELVG